MEKYIIQSMAMLVKYKVVSKEYTFMYELIKTLLERMYYKGKADAAQEMLESYESKI